jgi:hypothetical protein
MAGIKPENSFGATLATMGLVFGIHQINMPNLADLRAANPHNSTVDSSRKAATWTAISACAALSLLARDPNIFIFGGGFAIVLDAYERHANMVHPATGQVTMPPAGGAVPGGVGASAS